MYLNIYQLAVRLSVKASWLRYKVFKKEIPYLKIGRQIRFEEIKVTEWIEKQNFKNGETYE